MKQLIQEPGTGKVEIVDLPAPSCARNKILVKVHASAISPGTEGMLMAFGQSSMIDKARKHPDKVKQVIDKVKTDGLATTYEAVRDKLSQPTTMGYSAAGEVIEVGDDVSGFSVGDKVSVAGAHGELIHTTPTMCAKVPAGVPMAAAAMVPLCSIALESVRLAEPAIGERFVVYGLGMLGLVASQLLKANGCKVLGVDVDPSKKQIADELGIEFCLGESEEVVKSRALSFAGAYGVDGVIVAAGTPSDRPINVAAEITRVRGRVIQLGVTGLGLVRETFFRKEIRLQISHSFGPGRNDPSYEVAGHDYPLGFVRWTVQRNFEALLDLQAGGQIDLGRFVSHSFDFGSAASAYELIINRNEPSLGVILEYPDSGNESLLKRAIQTGVDASTKVSEAGMLIIGAGNYAGRMLLPAIRNAGARIAAICNSGGPGALHLARKFKAELITTSAENAIRDDNVNAVAIASRHDSHASYACMALKQGKHVFVEKPMALSMSELDEIEEAWKQSREPDGSGPLIMVGFNRRFAPLVTKMKSLIASSGAPKSFIMTMNAGNVPADHWLQDPKLGGGRIVGEACHYIDLMKFLCGSTIESVSARSFHGAPGVEVGSDKAILTLTFSDGSIGSIHYLANGASSFPKERVEVFWDGQVLQLDNFRKLKGFGVSGFTSKSMFKQDKGHRQCMAEFVHAITSGGPAPIPFEELLEVSRVSIEAQAMAEE